jgi:hypoxanthine phosphoribosyltransferase
MSETGKHLQISWDAYHRAIEELAVLVHDSGWQFDQVLGLARGGLRIGDVFSRLFDVPLAVVSARSYRGENGKERGELDIARHITMSAGTLSGKVLLVDDMVDSGITLERVQSHIKDHFPEVTEVRTAVIWYKAWSQCKPDYFLQYLADNPWIHQPFEEYEGMTIEALKDRLKNK